MKIGMLFHSCHRRGGIERVMVDCANFLYARGHDVHVYTANLDDSVLDPHITVHLISARRNPSWFFYLDFLKKCVKSLATQSQGEDVRASFGVVSPADSVVWVTSVHKKWMEVSACQRDWKGRLRQKCNPFHPLMLKMERDYFKGRRYLRLIALTEDVKNDLIRFYGVPPEDIDVLPNGYSPTEFNVSRASGMRSEMRATLNYDDQAKVVVFVANELERKGFGPLLRAVALLSDPDIHLLVVGKITPDAYIDEISKLGMTDRVQFVGSASDVTRYYAASDVFALPTQYEAWGLVIVEAMACGLPALTSKLAGAAIAVSPGDNGELLDDPNDLEEISTKLKSLLTGNHKSAIEISSSVVAYSWDVIIEKYEKILRDNMLTKVTP